jgi:hypothetical protein
MTYPHLINHDAPVLPQTENLQQTEPLQQNTEVENTIRHRREWNLLQASTDKGDVEREGTGRSRRFSEDTLSTVENNKKEASPNFRGRSSRSSGRENDRVPSMKEEDIRPPSEMNAVRPVEVWGMAIGKLCSLSVEVRAIFENEAQSNNDASLRHVHDEYCFDRIIQEVLKIILLIRDKHLAKRLKESSENGLLTKLTRMLEKISKRSIPAFKNILKVGVTGSAVCSLTRSSLCLFNKR